MGAEPSLPQRLAFLVQLRADATAGQIAGRISHLVSARSVRFGSYGECLAFIACVLREDGGKELVTPAKAALQPPR